MRVILLGDTVRYPLTGIGRYTVELFRALSVLSPHVSLWRRGAIQTALPADRVEPSGTVSGLKQRLLKWGSRWPMLLDRALAAWQWIEACQLSRFVTDTVVHGPNYHVPALQCARVVTLHDLSVMTWSECHQPDRVIRMKRMMHASVRAAHRIITDSEFNRREVLTYFGLSDERVVSVPLACDARFNPHSSVPNHLALPECYALWVGTVEPRKNLNTLLSAWQALPDEWRMQVPLVIAGGVGWRSEATHARLRQAEQEGWLRYLGFVSDSDLPGLYAGARLFCFPSCYEGFGLPVLEAMASGVPVVSSTAACLPEIGGDAVRYADPSMVQDWVREILTVLSSPQEALRLRTLGLARAAEFTWERTARATLEVYRQACMVFEGERT